jgi:hypothetical protein|tara:strand:- start:2366 stop:3400 length:1035 start_codon:yes stop_codon:yes gene_type:complete
MKSITLNIGPDVEDTYLKKGQEWMTKIVDASHKHDKVTISFEEGPALEQIVFEGKTFLDILRDLCKDNNWPLEKFHFTTMNLTQDKTIWPLVSVVPLAGHFLSCQKHAVINNKNVDKTFGMFVGRSSWDRLLLASHLYNRHKDKTIQTYRTYLDNPSNMLHIDINRLLWQISSYNNKTLSTINVMDSTTHFIKNLPLLLDDSHPGATHIQWNSGAVDNDIISWYNNIFIDVVCEKMVTGQTFFPTEKTARPLATKTPFLIMAAPNYIKNLHKLGFRSFSQFWDESYDYQQGMQRVHSIQGIIDELARLPINELRDMYQEMLPILEHNHKIYHSLTGKNISSKFL